MSIFADIRYALRLTVNDWRFSITLIATLAIGIAASGALFNVVNASLLRPLPIPDESRVYRLQDYTMNDSQRVLRSNRVPNFVSIRDEASSFSSIVGGRRVEWSFIAGDAVVPTAVALISPGSLELLGAKVQLGRMFTADEASTGLAANVVLLSHSFWMRQFGGRPEVMGTTVRIDSHTPTVVGVLAPGFRFPYDAELWMPDRIDPTAGELSLAVFGRLRDGVTRPQAEAELDAIAARAESVRPVANRGLRFAMTPIRESLVGDQTSMSMMLLGAAITLLLLSSANVANLLLARGTRRAREIAVRAALGAERGRQLRQQLVESVVYAAIGTAIGLTIAAPLTTMVVALVPNVLRDQLGLTNTNIDWRAAAFAALVTGGVGILAGVMPALRASRTDVGQTLRMHSRGVSAGSRLMRSLVVAEVALAAVLLFTAGVMVLNLQRVLNTNLGLRANQLISVRMPLPPRYDTAERRIQIAQQLIDAASALPGTEEAGVVTQNPLERGSVGAALESEERPLSPGQGGHIVNHRMASSRWLNTAGVTLVAGRLFEGTDTSTSLPVAVVSQRLASRFWPGGDPLGKRVRQIRAGAPWITVVGVVGDVKDTGDWTDTWYVPYDQHAGTALAGTLNLMIRSRIDTTAALNGLRGAVKAIDPLMPIPEPVIMTAMWETAQTQQRVGTIASTLFAVSGWLLAALGTYGVLAYLVSIRTREFGIRQALGATPRTVLTMVLRDGGKLVLIGLSVGAVLSIAALRVLQSMTPDMSSVPIGLALTVGALLATAAMFASAVPALRATKASPVDVMRSE